MGIFRAALFPACVAALLLVSSRGATVLGQGEDDPFSFFQPAVTLTADDRDVLDGGEVVVRVLPGEGTEVAVFAASRLDASPEALVHWTRQIEELKKGRFVQAISRFSDPPVLSDLDGLVIDETDLEAIRRCEEGDCGLKLDVHEIRTLRAAAQAGGDWQAAVQREFRRVVFERVMRYRAAGLAGLPAYVDQSNPVRPHESFATLLDRSPYLRSRVPSVAEGLLRYPTIEIPGSESFLYWSKEHYGRGKAVVAVTQVHIVRSASPALPPVMVLGQEIFASHYRTASLGLTTVLEGADGRYLAYLNRSSLDAVGGFLGGLKRTLIERRLGSGVKPAITVVRRRLESTAPRASN